MFVLILNSSYKNWAWEKYVIKIMTLSWHHATSIVAATEKTKTKNAACAVIFKAYYL